MKSKMDEQKQNSEKEASSLDIVELDSSDDDINFDESEMSNITNRPASLALKVRRQDDLASHQNSFPKAYEDDIDSEEERDILKGIRDEVEGKVREEMKDELQMYQTRLLAIEAGELPQRSSDEKIETNDAESEAMDPKLKEAFAKMHKLDKILMKKVKREKEVKRERLILEKKLRDEISEMQHGAKHYKDIKLNTERFLALAPPQSHNEGVSLDFEEEEDIPPLFQTQIDDCEIKRKSKRRSSVKGDIDKDEVDESCDTKTPTDEAKSRADSSASGEGRTKSSKKNFIKRNKELAAAANEVIAMTDDEKNRLQDLLGDIDELPELDEGSLDGTESSIFQLALNPGDGFVPDDIEFKSLTSIDEKLKHIMPEDEYLSILSVGSSQQSTPRPTLFTRVGVKSTANLLDGFGEQVLYETKEERDLKARLDSIEKKLEVFKGPQETETGRTDYHLSDEQLDNLLNQCARSMSRASVMETPHSTARSEVSSRQMLMENPPKLSDEQLQELLSQAYFPMSSQLSALSEDIGEDGNAISAETWKTIMDENLEEDDDWAHGKDNQNVSQNALTESKEYYDESYEYDNLLSEGEADHNLLDEFKDDPSPQQLKSKQRSRSKEFKGLPKISSSGMSLTGQSSSLSDSINHGNPVSFKRNNESPATADQLRLPSISSNSFLIHASQGLNNRSSSSQENASSKEPIPMVHNNLSDMSVTSFSEENGDYP